MRMASVGSRAGPWLPIWCSTTTTPRATCSGGSAAICASSCFSMISSKQLASCAKVRIG